jgi:hypothetical protein
MPWSTDGAVVRYPYGVSKLIGRKWRIASGLGFAAAIALDMTAKHFAAEEMLSIANGFRS